MTRAVVTSVLQIQHVFSARELQELHQDIRTVSELYQYQQILLRPCWHMWSSVSYLLAVLLAVFLLLVHAEYGVCRVGPVDPVMIVINTQSVCTIVSFLSNLC